MQQETRDRWIKKKKFLKEELMEKNKWEQIPTLFQFVADSSIFSPFA